MPKGENMQTVALNLDRDHYKKDVRPAAAAAGLSASEWIRRAIAEKLDGAPDDARLSRIGANFDRLNDKGRDWLAECSEVAASHQGFRS